MTGQQPIAGKLSGVPALIAYSMVTRIQKSDITVNARTNQAVFWFGLIRAKYGEDPDFRTTIQELQEDLTQMRKDYESVIDYETWAQDEKNQFDIFLDGIEWRLSEIVVKSKVIDFAGLREMAVPD